MAFVKVKNKKGTGNNPPPSGYTSWLAYWESKKGKGKGCEVLGCSGSADVGGHVIKSGDGPKEYILPLCSSCNNKSETVEFEAWDGDLVPVT